MRILVVLRLAVVTTIYVVLTMSFFSISFGAIQFRVAEILMLLCFYDKRYIFAVTLGCFISNLYSPLGVIDMFVGTLATFLSGLAIIYLKKNLLIAAIWPVLINGIIIGTMLTFVNEVNPVFPSIFIVIGYVALGEMLVMIVGFILFRVLERNEDFMEIIVNINKSESL